MASPASPALSTPPSPTPTGDGWRRIRIDGVECEMRVVKLLDAGKVSIDGVDQDLAVDALASELLAAAGDNYKKTLDQGGSVLISRTHAYQKQKDEQSYGSEESIGDKVLSSEIQTRIKTTYGADLGTIKELWDRIFQGDPNVTPSSPSSLTPDPTSSSQSTPTPDTTSPSPPVRAPSSSSSPSASLPPPISIPRSPSSSPASSPPPLSPTPSTPVSNPVFMESPRVAEIRPTKVSDEDEALLSQRVEANCRFISWYLDGLLEDNPADYDSIAHKDARAQAEEISEEFQALLRNKATSKAIKLKIILVSAKYDEVRKRLSSSESSHSYTSSSH